MNIVDTHTHLHSYTTGQLIHTDIIDSWQKAWNLAQTHGVTHILNIFNIAHEHEMNLLNEMHNTEGIYLAAAVHPCNVDLIGLDNAHSVLMHNMYRLDCIGETGIDTYKNSNTLETQTEYFLMHLDLAIKYNKPICIHYRNNDQNNDVFIQTLIDIMKSYCTIRFVMHCCTFDWKFIKPLMDEFSNCYISISGIVTYPKAIAVQNLARNIPLHRLLIETDSPFLTPQTFQLNRFKQNNQSAYVKYVYESVALIRNIPTITLYESVFDNFQSFLTGK